MSRQKKTGHGDYKYYTVTFRGPDGRRHVVRSKTNKGIDELVRQKKAAVFGEDSPSNSSENTLSYYQWVENYINQKALEKTLSRSYISLQHLFAKNFIKDTCGSKYLCDITLDDLESVMNLAKSKECSNSTCKQIRLLLNASLDKAVQKKQIESNPARYLEKVSVSIESYEQIPRHIMQMLLDAIRNNPKYQHYALLVETYLKTGGRRGEILGLERKHFDKEKKQIDIKQSLKQDGKNLYLSSPKTGKSGRAITLSDELSQKIADVLSAPNRKLWIGPDGKEHDFIFLNAEGLPFFPHSVSMFFRKLRDRLATNLENEKRPNDAEQMRKVHLHSTRHYCISHMARNPKFSLADVRDFAGHTNISITNRYIGTNVNKELGKFSEEIID